MSSSLADKNNSLDAVASLKGTTAWITGASSGIGAATAKRLAAAGVNLVLSARRTQRLEQLAAELQNSGVKIYLEPVDVAQRPAMEALGQRLQELGGVDILINNAGIMPISPILSGRVDEWEQMIDVNLKGLLYAIHQVYPGMVARQQGHIVNISSVAARITFPSAGVYAGTKHAVRAVSDTLRKEALRYGVRVTDIQPGSVATELPDSIQHDKVRAAVKANLYADSSQILQPEDVAAAIYYALSQPKQVDVSELILRPVNMQD